MATEFVLDASAIVEGIEDLHLYTDENIEDLVNHAADAEWEKYVADIEERAETLSYPCFGATTDDVFQTPQEYIDYKMDIDIKEEKITAIEAIKKLRNQVTFTVSELGWLDFEVQINEDTLTAREIAPESTITINRKPETESEWALLSDFFTEMLKEWASRYKDYLPAVSYMTSIVYNLPEAVNAK